MAVIPKQVVGGIATRLLPESRILNVVLEGGADGTGAPVDTGHLDRSGLAEFLQLGRVLSVTIAVHGSHHLAVVEATEPGEVEVWLRCSVAICGNHPEPIADLVPARSEAIVQRILELVEVADRRVGGGAGGRRSGRADLPSVRVPPAAARRRRRGTAEPAPVEPDPIDADEVDYGEWFGDEDERGDVPPLGSAEPPDPGRPEELRDLVDPPLRWGPGFDRLDSAVARVATGADQLADLLPDVDACTVRSHGRRLAQQLPTLRARNAPAPGGERDWIAGQLQVAEPPQRSLVELWDGLDRPDRESVCAAVEGGLVLFDGSSGSAAPWCETAARLLDAAARDVPPTVRTRVGDPVELVASAASALATRSFTGQVPGRDVTGVDLWFAVGAGMAELAARGPLIGANEHGELPAGGLVVVVGDVELRRRFLDAVELGADQRPTVRVVAEVPSGPHLAALATTRGSAPVLLNSPSARSPFAARASLPHLRRTPDPEGEARRVAERWAAITPVGRDGWWEAMPHTYLPALLHGLMLENVPDLCAGSVVPAIDEDRLEDLQRVCRHAGRHDVADRLAGIIEPGVHSTTKASVRLTISAALPQDPPASNPALDPARLGRRAVVLPGDAVAVRHAATDLAELGCDVLWDDVGALDRGALWCSRHPGALTVLGYPTLAAVDLPADVLRSATVVGLHGCGDLSPLAGRTVEVDPGEAALVRQGTITLAEPVDRLLGSAVAEVHRDAFVRRCTRIVRDRRVA